MTAYDPAEAQAAEEAKRLAAKDDQGEASFAVRLHAADLATLDANAMARLAAAAHTAGVLARTEPATRDYIMVGLGTVPDYLLDALPPHARIDRYT